MPKLSDAQARKQLRESIMQELVTFFQSKGEDAFPISGNAISFPCIDANGNEGYVKITVSIPTGEHGGDKFDGYELKQEYEFTLAKKAEVAEAKKAKQAEAAEKRAKHIEALKAKKEKKEEQKNEVL